VIRPRRPQPFAVLWLTAVWVLLWGNLSAANVLGGLVLSLFVLTAFPLPRIIVGVRVHPWWLVVLGTRFLWDVVRASVELSWLAVRPQAPPRSSVVTVPMRSRNELFLTIVGEMASLVPGSLVIDLDGEQGLLSMHVLGVDSPESADAFRVSMWALERRVLRALAAEPDGGRPIAVVAS
jgi:multicomponent Na+:H+ antiporter subunit E